MEGPQAGFRLRPTALLVVFDAPRANYALLHENFATLTRCRQEQLFELPKLLKAVLQDVFIGNSLWNIQTLHSTISSLCSF